MNEKAISICSCRLIPLEERASVAGMCSGGATEPNQACLQPSNTRN